MNYMNEVKPADKASASSEIIVRVWEGFLNRSKLNLLATLEPYSLTEICTDLDYRGTITFRFTLYDWHKTLREMLVKHNIPFMQVDVLELTSFN